MARRTKATREDKAVEYVAHRKDKRVNIPTAELADFAVKEERASYILRYPRKPELDPQLVWKGKDEQDGHDLEVPAVPVYIQEHIHPSAIIEDLRREQAEGKPRQARLLMSQGAIADASEKFGADHKSLGGKKICSHCWAQCSFNITELELRHDMVQLPP